MADISIAWKKITRGLPKVRRYADVGSQHYKIQKIIEYSCMRIKAVVYTISSLVCDWLLGIILGGIVLNQLRMGKNDCENDCLCRRSRKIFFF
jgi:hypothetical protein